MSSYRIKTPYVAPSYAQIMALKGFPPDVVERSYQNAVDRLAKTSDVQVSNIAYDSDSLLVTGVEVLPSPMPGEKIPLIIYNRGGSGNFGMLNPFQILSRIVPFAKALQAGVLASNYRGNGGSEGHEEWGGSDVNDVLNLIEIGKKQAWWDGKNIFMLGWSRGGMMTYLAIKHGVNINAAAVGAGVSDIAASLAQRPEMRKVCERFIPHFTTNEEQVLVDRSAIHWPEKITAPLLLLHGDADERVDVEESRRLYKKLTAFGSSVKYVEFPGGDHGLSQYRHQVSDEITRWFNAYRIG